MCLLKEAAYDLAITDCCWSSARSLVTVWKPVPNACLTSQSI